MLPNACGGRYNVRMRRLALLIALLMPTVALGGGGGGSRP